MTDLALFREYELHELGEDGYPRAWHEVKHQVRAQADHRCVRCGHPFVVGQSGCMEGPSHQAKAFAAEFGVTLEQLDFLFLEVRADAGFSEDVLDTAPRVNWSECDERCTHRGPLRARRHVDQTEPGYDALDDQVAGRLVRSLGDIHRFEAAWRILTVHHLNGDKADLRWWNLVAVCQRCHLCIQRKVVMDRPWPWEHTEWFRVHAAAWYAQKYRGESLTREQTLGRLDELLTLGRDEEQVERMAL